MSVNRFDKSLKGGVELRRVPVIQWAAYIACGLNVYKDGKVKPCVFEPQPMVTPNESFQTTLLLMAAQRQKSGPIDWGSVPPEVARHFRFADDQSS